MLPLKGLALKIICSFSFIFYLCLLWLVFSFPVFSAMSFLTLAGNVPQTSPVAACWLLSCRDGPRLKRSSWLHHASEKRQLRYILLLCVRLFFLTIVSFCFLIYCCRILVKLCQVKWCLF